MDKKYTQASILEAFKVLREKIVSPGKYEGAPLFAPYFDAKTESRGKGLHTIRDEDRREFPELNEYKTVRVTREQRPRHGAGVCQRLLLVSTVALTTTTHPKL
jgi:hypothetical protein